MKIILWVVTLLFLLNPYYKVFAAGTVPSPTKVPTLSIASNELVIETDGIVKTQIEDNGRLYLGGEFTSIKLNEGPESVRKNIAVLDLSQKSVTEWNPQPDKSVEDIALTDSHIYIAGMFSTFSGKNQAYVAKVDKTTLTLVPFSLQPNGPVYGLETHNNVLYLGGSFTQINGENRNRLASYDTNTDQLTSWNPDANGTVYAVASQKGVLYVGGEFTTVSGQNRMHIAAFDLNTGNVLPWNPQVEFIVKKIMFENENVIAIGTREGSTSEERVQINPNTGSVTVITVPTPTSDPNTTVDPKTSLKVDESALGFKIPTLSDILTFVVRGFFVIAGLAALFYMLLGALAWVTSGGDKDSIQAARDKIQAAIVGVIMIVVVLAIVWTLEQVVFKRTLCLGISCPVIFPSLIEPT